MKIEDSLLAQLVRGLADAVIIADAEGNIVFWNEAATSVFGWPATEATGRYAFPKLEFGDHQLRVTAAGIDDFETTVTYARTSQVHNLILPSP